ncbi:hypothetical protein HPB47_006315 [Ixodes persulcatus]|uniref:Uncharacterized protein n=1 Tax=Ixodes persulcatus TaxID=34615 RepID=A0AC60PAS1_IXOPE|nr:hypothetical protein HPB47_006315 [Ixodes persulcatus]
MRGRIAPAAFRILSSTPSWDTTIPIRLIWTPAHAELEGNEQAHELACELANQADDQDCSFFPVTIFSYRDILNYYKETRKTYPEPHPALGRHQATILRQIQTNTLPNPVLFRTGSSAPLAAGTPRESNGAGNFGDYERIYRVSAARDASSVRREERGLAGEERTR